MPACQTCRLSECDAQQEACICCCHKSEMDEILDGVIEEEGLEEGEDAAD